MRTAHKRGGSTLQKSAFGALVHVRKGQLVLAAALVASGPGCNDTTSETEHAVVTSVAVDPADFLGTLQCSGNPGAIQSYSAEVVDLDTGASVATSPPLSCTLPVAFEQVVEEHRYFANIKVFDLPPESVTAATPPTATTSCGAVEGFAVVNADERVFIHGCDELSGAGTSTTSIEIDTKALVEPLGCAADGGAIDSLRVSAVDPPAGSLPDVVISCGQGPVGYATDLAPNAVYRFTVRAFGPGAADAGWVSSCTATTVDGVRVDAACSPLSSSGTIQIDLPSVLADQALVCGEGDAEVASYDVVFDENLPAEIDAAGIPCATSAVVGPAAPGGHGGEITLRNSVGKRVAHAICFVDTKPGVTVTAPCVPD